MKKFVKILIAFLLVLVAATVGASFYFFHVAQVREDKSFISKKPTPKSSPIYQDEKDFLTLSKQTLTLENDDLTLKAWYVPAETKTDKTVIVVHGFNGSKEKMTAYGMMFHKLGYNVLMPDNRAHGDSEGTLIGYGVTDKRDLIKWTNKLIKADPKTDITYFGLSMGAATVMLASGEKLPENVHNIIEDCGYSSVWGELTYQAKEMYGLPKFPLLYEVSAISKIRAGFSYGEAGASSVKALEHNKLPVLFIHGSADDFVPTKMVYQNYAATKGPKELFIVKGAKHAQALEKDKSGYYAKVTAFLKNNSF
ncbi:alpha/beta hydrolase [Lactococcus insecticola]|uniref:AB hydrolase-1 domain-containing protein n=1 Tax=Pseudolactococcus insecticola TaxID=2709158 RepID=A0A6A0B7S5_9LACT|nr:hypothetical protein Hs20B_08020 [Lactococcus insecticola]